jgi:iron complex outermembrane receptor protein/hemoglobin/transferrin/lactoferrin receptor protein
MRHRSSSRQPLRVGLAALVVASVLSGRAHAAPPVAEGPAPTGPVANGPVEKAKPDDAATARKTRKVRVAATGSPDNPERAATVVERREMEERLPRSAPDALRYEPGVYVQQSAHGQASPYLRGLTGQQTLLMFDGIRLNNSTFRAGPNQYFFTVDARSIQRLEVLKGAASTRFGSDALGGVLKSKPIEPGLADRGRVDVHGRGGFRTGTSDRELGGYARVDVGAYGKVGFVAGVGYRDVGRLRTAGAVRSPATGEPHKEPRFEDDARTQLGTGFRELTADARLVFLPGRDWRLTAGYYDYRQFDAPRTDKCPPAEAPEDECLVYLRQYRTLAYLAAEHRGGGPAAEWVRLTVSFQEQHERRQLTRDNGIPELPGGTESNGDDRVHTGGIAVQVRSAGGTPAPWFSWWVDYGADGYLDLVDSKAWLRFTDTMVPVRQDLSRGQYLDDGRYLTAGAFTELQTWFASRVGLRAGGRLAVVHAEARGDPASASASVDRTWVTPVGGAGLSVLTWPFLSLHANVDQGFRAPNLDDLTSRQQTGPGFQFENASLDPERATTIDAGFRIRHAHVEANLFAFRTSIDDFISRAPREVGECPDQTIDPTGCAASRTRFQLVNLAGKTRLFGVDGGVRVFFPLGFRASATVAWARGDGPNPVPPPVDPASGYQARLPLSRVPPLNGTVELGWRQARGFWFATALRWATAQTRLALQDAADIRIPPGGTPGFAVIDLRAGYRWDPHVLVGLVFENIGDTAYRYHGSSVNGAERSLTAQLELGF